jgi:hypothetical protein
MMIFQLSAFFNIREVRRPPPIDDFQMSDPTSAAKPATKQPQYQQKDNRSNERVYNQGDNSDAEVDSQSRQ